MGLIGFRPPGEGRRTSGDWGVIFGPEALTPGWEADLDSTSFGVDWEERGAGRRAHITSTFRYLSTQISITSDL